MKFRNGEISNLIKQKNDTISFNGILIAVFPTCSVLTFRGIVLCARRGTWYATGRGNYTSDLHVRNLHNDISDLHNVISDFT